MSIPLELSEQQRQIVDTVAAVEPPPWRATFYNAVTDCLLGRGHREITDDDLRIAITRAVNAADRMLGDDYDDCCCG